MISNIQAQRFHLLFQGKNNSYVVNELPTEMPEEGKKFKTKIRQQEGTVDKSVMLSHLEGKFGVGICPVMADGKAFFGVIDIDYYGRKLKRMLDILREYQLPLLPFRSKSGGLHLYFIVGKSVPAKKIIKYLEKVCYSFALEGIFGKGKVEIFPKQDRVSEGGFGSAITLPYFNAENAYTYLMDLEGNKFDLNEALDYIQKNQADLDEAQAQLEHLPFNDAPPCIQHILLSGVVGKEDSGRNNFLFSYAVYAKKKYGTGFERYVRETNANFQCPMPDSDVEALCQSVSSHEYIYKCKDIPCNSFCDKVACKKREYGLGRDKSHFTGIDYGKLYRYMAAEPYYIWKLRLQGQEEWKDVVFKDEGYLLDQRNFAKMCVRYLNQAPMQVSPNDWYAILNSVLPDVQNVEVKKESDTSVSSLLKNAFIMYLSNKQARRDSPYQIKVGLCVRQTTGNKAKYYFTHKGFADYLRNQKISFDYAMLREQLLSFGAVEDELVYTNALNEEKHYVCWSKEEDKDINEAYEGAVEIEEGDKNRISFGSVSEVNNMSVEETSVEKKYTDKDLKEAEDLF